MQAICHTSHRGSRSIPLLLLDYATRRAEWSASRTCHSLPPGKTRYPLNRRLVGPQSRSGQVRKISPPKGFDPRTVQPVASRYTDYASRPVSILIMLASKMLHRYCRKFCYIIFIYCNSINPVIKIQILYTRQFWCFCVTGNWALKQPYDNKTGNVRWAWHWVAFVQQLLQRKSNKTWSSW